MKKTLIALGVLAAAGTANAGINIYDADGVTVDFGGDIEVVYIKSTTKDSSMEQDIQDADFSFDTRYAINDEYTVGAFWEFSGDAGQADTGDVYVALYTADMGSIKVGKTATIFDDAGVGSDYQFGISKAIDDVTVGGEETIKYQIDTGMVYGGVAFMDNKQGGDRTADMNIGVRVAGFDAVVFYGQTQPAGTTEETDVMAVELRYAIDAVNLEAGYYDTEDTADSWALAADYSVDLWTFATGYSVTTVDKKVNAAEPETKNWFVNAGYGIAPNTKIYAEVGGADIDGTDTDTGYAIGVKAEF
ncbi:porin [Vibrio hannami]|uniref:porin n=1 Tax=Vibrio hannami TaxID=2717094 RepID=UPI00240F67FF|nr:porin [Vibrio hannami]MDG3087680.1 porin [Vibrio hannami]